MTSVDRSVYDLALRTARLSAYEPGEFVGQESFMSASEILALARRAGVAAGVSVLDLCCGVAGPGNLITRVLGCRYLGLDSSPEALTLARERASRPGSRFEVSRIPPVPNGPFDVVLLLETMLAFPDKQALIRQIARALVPGGRFAFTLEEGLPLSEAERRRMPASQTIWPCRVEEMVAYLDRAGMAITWSEDWTDAHARRAQSLTQAFAADAACLIARLGRDPVEELVLSHRLWSAWLATGRVRKLALVAERTEAPRLRRNDLGNS